MIRTVTLNPAIDHFVRLEQFELGHVNRAKADLKVAGGKGINISKVLKNLGHTSVAHGLIGGFTGRFVQEQLERDGIVTEFTAINADTRINMKIQSNMETEINGVSPQITENELNDLEKKLGLLQDGDSLVLAGSVPETMPSSIYERLLTRIDGKDVQVFVDTSGAALHSVIEKKPTFIKPNHYELAELFSTTISTKEEAIPYVRELLSKGIQFVLVSFAGDGALLGTDDAIYMANVPTGEVVNSVGAGDSVVAGFLTALSEGQQIEKVFAFAVASGSATAFSQGFCQREAVETLTKEVFITKWGDE
ncbi:1-phosphofructokinase [Halalkalibacter sp. APA_J-10(15)]|uniref:1-phosphofructokinase n=1 Tax=Halalkalibacter sp. APA_J-10(15) TaxID=2933805 RepID=UPI001FF4D921|nr:1-phosphofructokinase [Halalkalibacter sp. APA_J-10(15)]MCK0472434.1 1-phosphofructokinase [Halalkalibacter sp. APA_J-10(15)]